MLDWRRLVHEPAEELGRLDLAEVHLACAAGLPGSERIDHDRCIRTLDSLAGWVKRYTDHCLPRRLEMEPGDSEGRFRMRALGTVVCRSAGIRYNPAKIPEDAPWGLEDTFIHGALFGDGGTCATLPVVFVSVGRRLGYPLKLASGWAPKSTHLFCRWEGAVGERFNFEANQRGVDFPTDDYYRRFGQERRLEELGLFLKSKTPQEELAVFLAERGCCWRDCGRLRQCVDAFAWATGLSPTNGYYLNALKIDYNRWLREVKQRQPPRFPDVYLKVVQRRYPTGVPLALEQDILCLEAIDNLLNDPEPDGKWWAALRRGELGVRTPSQVLVDSRPDRLEVGFRFPATNN
jgi:hypothetical protein